MSIHTYYRYIYNTVYVYSISDYALHFHTQRAGAACGDCGCPARCHETVAEANRRERRQRVLQRKAAAAAQHAAQAKEAAAMAHALACAGRVREACRRVVDAEKSGEYIRETRLDFITQAKRGKNPHAKECPGFTVKFRERDALLPEVMLFCR